MFFSLHWVENQTDYTSISLYSQHTSLDNNFTYFPHSHIVFLFVEQNLDTKIVWTNHQQNMQHPKWVHHKCPDTTSVNRVKFLNTAEFCVCCAGLGRVGHRQAWRLVSIHIHLHVFKSVKRVSLTLLFAFTHALYWAEKLTKDPMCIKESLSYLQDRKYSVFTMSVVKWGKHALNL